MTVPRWWRVLPTYAKVLIALVVLTAIVGLAGLIPISSGGGVGPITPG